MKTNFKLNSQLIAFVLLVAVLFIGCELGPNVKKKNTGWKYNGNDISIYEIDSCEYVYVSNGNASWGGHKGNCMYCLARNTK